MDDLMERTCAQYKYYTQEHMVIWGKLAIKFNKCNKLSVEGAIQYSLEDSNCQYWEPKE